MPIETQKSPAGTGWQFASIKIRTRKKVRLNFIEVANPDAVEGAEPALIYISKFLGDAGAGAFDPYPTIVPINGHAMNLHALQWSEGLEIDGPLHIAGAVLHMSSIEHGITVQWEEVEHPLRVRSE